MDKPKLTVLLVLVISAHAAAARAQALEISAGVGAARVDSGNDFWWGRGVSSPAVDGKLAFAFNDRFAVESFLTYGRRSFPASEYGPSVSGGDTQVAEGVYGILMRQRVMRGRSGLGVFVSYGLGGMYSRYAVPARQYFSGRTPITYPAYTSNETQGMWFPIGGMSVQQRITDHLAVRVDGQVTTFFGLPIGGRGSVGLVVPIGRTASATRRLESR